MYGLQVKTGYYEYAPYKAKPGLDLTTWATQYLVKLGLTITVPCCGKGPTNLYLKQGTYKFTTQKDKSFFDFESYFLKVLVHYGVISQPTADLQCCKLKARLRMPVNMLYFDRTRFKKNSIDRWLYNLLVNVGQSPDDPCCLTK